MNPFFTKQCIFNLDKVTHTIRLGKDIWFHFETGKDFTVSYETEDEAAIVFETLKDQLKGKMNDPQQI